MKPNEITPRYERVMRCFAHLPQQILSLHEADNITEFVLHSLCDEGCLNLSKAAYFIDNPDFDFLKGVAGFNKEEEIYTCDTVLSDPGHFKQHVENCGFNAKVKGINLPSSHRKNDGHASTVRHLSGLLGLENPQFQLLNIKHDNHGLLLFERGVVEDQETDQEFLKGLSLLGFCPVN